MIGADSSRWRDNVEHGSWKQKQHSCPLGAQEPGHIALSSGTLWELWEKSLSFFVSFFEDHLPFRLCACKVSISCDNGIFLEVLK
jgi:hypothetical protein